MLQVSACASAFGRPQQVELKGFMISGAPNTVHLRVACAADLIIMKVHAVRGRDKPKDVYDLCYCLDEFPDASVSSAEDWGYAPRSLVAEESRSSRTSLRPIDHYGPEQLEIFHDSADPRNARCTSVVRLSLFKSC